MNVYWAWYDCDGKSGSGVVVAESIAAGLMLCLQAAPDSYSQGWHLSPVDTSSPGTYDLEISAD